MFAIREHNFQKLFIVSEIHFGEYRLVRPIDAPPNDIGVFLVVNLLSASKFGGSVTVHAVFFKINDFFVGFIKLVFEHTGFSSALAIVENNQIAIVC